MLQPCKGLCRIWGRSAGYGYVHRLRATRPFGIWKRPVILMSAIWKSSHQPRAFPLPRTRALSTQKKNSWHSRRKSRRLTSHFSRSQRDNVHPRSFALPWRFSFVSKVWCFGGTIEFSCTDEKANLQEATKGFWMRPARNSHFLYLSSGCMPMILKGDYLHNSHACLDPPFRAFPRT